jgi:YVTN family beta-propeller protein
MMASSSLLRALSIVVGAACVVATVTAQGVPRLDSYNGVAVRILQSNNAGNIHHIIDPATQRVTGVIKGCPHAHNLTTHPDGLYYYCSNEQQSTVDVFDTKTLQPVTQIPLSGRPNKIVVNKKHRKIYAAISVRSTKVVGPGFTQVKEGAAVVDVIDIATNKVIRSIPVFAPVHNTYVTPDDKFVVAGLNEDPEPGDPTIQVIDPVTDKVVWGMPLTGYTQYGRSTHEVRPMAFEANADGSVKRMFAQATGINAVWVIDWNKHQVVDMLWPPKLPLWKQNADGIQAGDMHGLEVLPDRSSLWASSRLDSRIYGWTLPDLKYIGAVEVGPTANWMTPTPDSKYMYVAVSGSDHTLAVDLKKLAIVAKIKTGARPARISTAILPLARVNDTPAASTARRSGGE